jgi:hypothetical protein
MNVTEADVSSVTRSNTFFRIYIWSYTNFSGFSDWLKNCWKVIAETVQQTCRKGHLVQLVSFKKVLKFEIPLKTLSDVGRDLVQGLLHLGQCTSVSLSPRKTTILKRLSQFLHMYSIVGMRASQNDFSMYQKNNTTSRCQVK